VPRRRGSRLPILGSPEKFQAFGEMLMPLLAQEGMEAAEPVVFPVHNFVNE
jgi:hypothetical protein